LLLLLLLDATAAVGVRLLSPLLLLELLLLLEVAAPLPEGLAAACKGLLHAF
jgi:hypothetical protein